MASAKSTLHESPYTVESLQAETEATRRLLHDRARKARLLAKHHEGIEAEESAAASTAATAAAQQGRETAVAQEEEEKDQHAEEGQEVEGGFDPNPELKSRFADKSSSLRFVTAEEDARMRKEELAKVFAVRNQAAAEDEEDPTSSSAAVREMSEEGRSSGGEGQGSTTTGSAAGDDGPSPTADGAGEGQAYEGLVGGKSQGETKAVGAILEKPLSQRLPGRVPPSGSAAAVATAGVVGAADWKIQALMSPPRQQQQQQSPKKATAPAPPPYKQKSKFFRALWSPPVPSQSVGNGATEPSRPLVTLPPAPMMGLLSQMRAQGGGGTGSSTNNIGEVQTGMGGLLAQIRAAKSVSGSGADGQESSSCTKGKGEDSGVAPSPLSQAPVPPLRARSVFPTAEPYTSAAPQDPPSDFFAQLRAKAAEKQASRLAAMTESNE